MKDNFSKTAGLYANYRPLFPGDLFEHIAKICNHRIAAWDCGTGNGQVAIQLANHFQHVYATDISQNQIDNAYWDDKITYEVEAAESCSFPDRSFDLIMVAQAVHWFDFDLFYAQVNRTLKKDGLLAILGYGLIRIDEKVDQVISELYKNTLGPYWDSERKYIDEEYKTIPFPYKQIDAPDFTISLKWNATQLLGYLNTWSAVQHYLKEKKENPVDLITPKLMKAWGKEPIKKIEFPVFIKLGRL
jgi:SAM-dependent methyltransferase